MRAVHIIEIPHQYPIKLEQHANGTFRVTYGAEVKDHLDFEDAPHEFGRCVFHALACAGLMNDKDSD